MLQALPYLFSGALAVCPAQDGAGATQERIPHAVWMRGSDIASPEVVLTHRLRDALEAEIAARQPELTYAQAAAASVVIYLPAMIVLDADAQEFQYSATLSERADSEFHTLAEANGSCRADDLGACSSKIYQQLTLVE